MTRRKHTHATSNAPSLLTPLPSLFFLPSPLLSNSLISRSIKVMAIHKHFSLQHSVSPLTRLTPCPSTANPPFQHSHDKQGAPSPVPGEWCGKTKAIKLWQMPFSVFSHRVEESGGKLTNFAKSFSNFASFYPPPALFRFSNCLCCAPFNQEKHFLLCKIMTLFLFCCFSSCCFNDYGCCCC